MHQWCVSLVAAHSFSVSLFIYNPIDLLKTRAQVNNANFVKYRHLIGDIVKIEGPSAFLKGITPGLMRDVP